MAKVSRDAVSRLVPEEFSALEAQTDGWFTERAGLLGVVHGNRLRTSYAYLKTPE
jgi:hypothetical protein